MSDVVAATNSALPAGKQAGVCLHITSLPGPFGIGEIGEQAMRFIDSMRDMGLAVWQFLPIGPTAYGDSPYQPLSTFAGNELLIDIAGLIELGLVTENEVDDLKTLPRDFVDYGALIPAKSRLLMLAASRFCDVADAELQSALRRFVERNDAFWLHDYALFRVIKSQYDEQPWPEWPPEYAHRDAVALRDLESSSEEQVNSIKIIQFLFERQWRRLKRHAHEQGVSLFGDMPIYISLDSSDAWANRELLQVDDHGRPDFVAGVPPDYFSEDGQLWGNPLYAWDFHAATGYDWWIQRMRACAKYMDIVRIDHFRGFESYWSVPADAETARHGSWKPGPGDALFHALSGASLHLPIIAEDLGVITPEVDALRERHQLPGMEVLQFAVCEPDFRLSDVDESRVCYTGTHDNDTTLGWFRGSDNDIQSDEEIRSTQSAALRVTQGTAETIHLDLIRAALSTDARLVVAPMQDFLGLGSEARINTPGTTQGNWRWRMQETSLSNELEREILDIIAAAGRN
jgi:4-alpha-glucanotransferase